MYNWEKLGLVFSPQKNGTGNWMSEFAQGPSVLIFDDYVRVYFSCRPLRESSGQYVSRSGWVDLERKNLTQIRKVCTEPVLPLGKLGAFDEFGTYPISVIQRGNEYWAYYAGWTRCVSVPFNVSIGAAVSNDGGATFKKLGDGPILSYSPDEPFILSGPKIRKFNNQYQLFYIAGKHWIPNDPVAEPVYRIRLATSTDGLNWVKHNKDLIPQQINDNECQASPDVYFKDGHYHMFFCYRHGLGYRGKEKGYRIGYAWSKDMLTWNREDEKAGLDISDQGWDSEMVAYPHVFELDGETYMFYLGDQVGRFGFGLARLKH